MLLTIIDLKMNSCSLVSLFDTKKRGIQRAHFSTYRIFFGIGGSMGARREEISRGVSNLDIDLRIYNFISKDFFVACYNKQRR